MSMIEDVDAFQALPSLMQQWTPLLVVDHVAAV